MLAYLTKNFKIRIIPDEFIKSLYELVPLTILKHSENKIIRLFVRAFNLSHILPLRTLDLLHLVYAEELHHKGIVQAFLTFYKELIKNAKIIENTLGITIIPENVTKLHEIVQN